MQVHCYIAICLKRHANAVPEWEEIAAVASAVQNLSLTATALGVSSVGSGVDGYSRVQGSPLVSKNRDNF